MPVSKQEVKDQLQRIGPFHKWFTGKEIRSLHKILADGEVIQFLTSGYDSKKDTCLVVATDRRFMVLNAGMLFGSDDQVFPYSKINSIRGERGLIFGTLHVSTAGVSGDDVTIRYITKTDLSKMIAVVSEQIDRAQMRRK